MGYYLDADQLKMRQTTQFSDMLRTVPGIRVQPAGDGTNVITSSRDATGGCVTFYVDGAPWQQMTPGDLDTYVRPEEVAALEVYNGATTPPQFQQPGQSWLHDGRDLDGAEDHAEEGSVAVRSATP